jgi:hypothetical protein
MANTMGTETIQKGQIYQRIKDLLLSAGWQNIASKPANDFDVFYSTGEAGDKTLYFQMKDTSNTSTTTGCYIDIRLINKYTPGAAGVAGTFDRPSEPWRNVYLFTAAGVSADTLIFFSYHVNKDRISFFADPPLPIHQGGNTGNIVYIGAPVLFETEINCRSLTLAQTFYNNTLIGGAAHNYVVTTNSPYSDLGSSEALLTYKITPSAEYNNSDKRVMSEIMYGAVSEGIRGKFDCFYVLHPSNTRTSHGDILTDGASTYKVVNLVTPAYWICTGTTMYAFQIS